jgi:hypothetical protein
MPIMLYPGIFLIFYFSAAIQAQYEAPNVPVHNQTHLQVGCPWLTLGTAAKALGGDAHVTVTMINSIEGSCRFLRQNSSDSLTIQVSKSDFPMCHGAGVKLLGIGNEAVRCMDSGLRGEEVERIRSRVRDLYFDVTHNSHREKASAKGTDLQNDALEQVAEAIAGNLY